MGEPINEPLVRRIAVLARLDLTDAEVAEFSRELSAILEYMDQLREVDTDAVPPTAHVLPVHNVLREDDPVPSPGSERALANAPDKHASFFRVPKVLDQEST